MDKDGRSIGTQIVNNMIRKGELHPKVGYYLNMEMISKQYGWLPSQIKKENAKDMNAYNAIIRGKGSLVPKQERRELENATT